MIRQILFNVMLIAIMVSPVTLFASESKKPNKPHIVVYLSDDHSQYDSSLYGDPTIPTPQMEKMAKAGMHFSNAFVASSLCARAG